MFRNFIMENFPFLENDFDALTDYELFCKMIQYVKEIVKDDEEFNIRLTNLENYINNLDLQEEVDNKLDEMAESGELTDIIAQYLGLAGVLAYDTKTDMKLAENIANGSILKTLGNTNYNDGLGNFYKARTITNEDVIDDDNIVALHNVTLVAEKIPDGKIGELANLTTSSKTNIVSAINEINTEITNLENMVPFYCVIRANSGGWFLLNDSDHTPLNVQSIEIDPNNSARLKLTHTIAGANKIYSFSIVPDETFTRYGIRAGASVGINESYIEIYQTIQANAYFRYQNSTFNIQAGYSNLVKSYDYDTTKHCLHIVFDDNLKCTTPEYWYADFNFATSTAATQLATKLKVLYTNLCEVEVYAYDETNTLLTTPGSLDRVNVFYEINRRVNPGDLVTHPITGSNFWICGYLKKTS